MLRYITRNIGNIDFLCSCWHTSSRNIHELQLMEGSFEHSFVNFILWISENYETIDMCLNNKAFPIEYHQGFLSYDFCYQLL